MRVGLIALQHESNTFVPTPTTLEQFRSDALLSGGAIAPAYGRSRHEVGGFFSGLDEAGIEAVPLLLALATPGGTVTAQTYDRLLAMLNDELDRAGPLDGLLVAPHGAGISEGHRDMDGHWLTALRLRVGPNLPMICTLDPHANVSQAMIQACEATIAYRTNPHVDQHETGLKAARLIARTLRGQVRPVQAHSNPPVAISIDKQHSSTPPCTGLYALASEIEARPDVLSVSVILGFPYADVEEMGSSFIVVTDGAAAQDHADQLADYLVNHRHHFSCDLPSVDAALDQAEGEPARVCLLDCGDNVGGGSPADSTILARAIHNRQISDSFVCLDDPQAAMRARAAGPGASLTLSMGGKTDHSQPLIAPVTVQSLHEGRFNVRSVSHGARTGYDMGPTAIVRTPHGLTIMLTSRRTPPMALEQLTSCDLTPGGFKLIVAKGVNAPLAAYRSVCDRFIRVNSPGLTGADMTQFQHRHRRRPLFPFEEPPV